MSGAETVGRRVVQRRVGGAEMALPLKNQHKKYNIKNQHKKYNIKNQHKKCNIKNRSASQCHAFLFAGMY